VFWPEHLSVLHMHELFHTDMYTHQANDTKAHTTISNSNDLHVPTRLMDD
jgi:hypothetical protein